MKATLLPIAMAVALSAASSDASAIDYSFSGTFTDDADVQLFDFSVGAESIVTLRTLSYAGGTNAAGTVIARGGFDPILALFDHSGFLIDQNDDGGFRVRGDTITGAHWDSYLRTVLDPGDYTVSIMQYANFARGPFLSNGFQGPYTTHFRDNAGNLRDGHWAFDLLNVNAAAAIAANSPASVPEPGTWLVLAVGLGSLGLARCRNTRKRI